MWNVGKFGDLRPYAVLEPVAVGGVTIKLATLHNEEDLVRKDIRAGEEVIVLRAGDVIPQVVSPAPHVVEHKRRPPPPAPARALPVLRHADGQAARTRSSRSAPTATAPSAPGSCSSTSSRAARWTSTGSARSRSRCCRSAGSCSTRGRLLPPDRRAAARARGLRRALGAQPARRRSRPPSSGRSRACCSRWGSRRWARSPGATSRSASATSTRCSRATAEEIAQTPGRRREDGRRRSARSCDDERMRALIADLRADRAALRRRGPGARRRARWRARRSCSPARCRAVARAGHRADPWPPAGA